MLIGQTISHYKILEKLGEGGMGIVYLARDTRLGRDVALKFLPPNINLSEEDRRRFEQEARAVSALNHPGIATLYDVDEVNGQKFLVLEYIPGGTLKTKLKSLKSEDKEFSLPEVVKYGVQIAEALEHAHRRQIVHRDVKSDNMMLTEEGKVKLTDFGLAKLRGNPQITRTGTTVGTIGYMSPEQVRGEEVDHRSDIFSLGIVLYELTTMDLPFRGEFEAALSYSILNEQPPSVKSLRPGAPDGLGQIIGRCLEKDKSRRYQHAGDVAADLKKLQLEPSVAFAHRIRMPELKWLITGALALMLALGVYLFIPRPAGPPRGKSVAVLPFNNLSDSKDDEYFADGITDDIITQISKIRNIDKVIARTSVMRYKGTKKSIREVGKDLDVATVLEGSVRRAGNKLRIVAQLIDVSTEGHLWAETYDRELQDVFAIQSDVANQIASALSVTLSPRERDLIAKKPTDQTEAYAYYLRGRELYYRYLKEDNENAISLFKKALQSDPKYAPAYAGLGDAYWQRVGRFYAERAWIDSSIASSTIAISLDPSLAEGYKALGLGYVGKGWWRKAFQAYRKALDLNPNYFPAVVNMGDCAKAIGDFVEELQWYKKGFALDPSKGINYESIGTVYMHVGLDEKAIEWYNKIDSLQTGYIAGQLGLSEVYLRQGDYQKATAYARKALSLNPDDVIAQIRVGYCELFLSHYPEALRILKQFETLTEQGFIALKLGKGDEARKLYDSSILYDQKFLDDGNESFGIPYDLAAIHAALGNKTDAMMWLQKAVDRGWRDYRYARIDPQLENLRNDDRFKRLMEDVKGKVDEMRKQIQETEKVEQDKG